MRQFQSFAIVPGAGRSRRMGQSKLLLRVKGRLLIDTVLEAWIDSAITHTIVVVRADDAPLIKQCRQHAVQVVEADPPPREMRDSIEIGLQEVARQFAPRAHDAWIVAPADLPGLTPAAVDEVVSRYDPATPRIVIPCQGGRQGHPVLLPWRAAALFLDASDAGGLDRFLAAQPVERLDAFESPAALVQADLDTPEDLRRL